ncbi:MAG: electron transfer flavoprotein subunit beta, partial [Spirochaetia bacterium]|nr:electron transfer flavoprotein subunit beta [Spirochaetia bacterium]
MFIVVPIKQVPQSSDVQMDPKTGTMIRSGTTSIINPLDLYALEAALELKDRMQATIAVISMGPPSAEKALMQALSMGCDQAYLLTDR